MQSGAISAFSAGALAPALTGALVTALTGAFSAALNKSAGEAPPGGRGEAIGAAPSRARETVAAGVILSVSADPCHQLPAPGGPQENETVSDRPEEEKVRRSPDRASRPVLFRGPDDVDRAIPSVWL